MRYYVWSLAEFKIRYWNELLEAQKEIYPNEPVAKQEDLIPFEENSKVVFALDGSILIGFCVFSICKEARNDLYFGSNLYFFVKSEYRKTLVPGRLILGSENVAKVWGCKYFKWDVNVDSDLVKAFNKRQEYKKESIIYLKNLI